MEAELSLEFLRVVENAAIAAARTMGFGDRHKADEVAVEAMRKTMDQLEMGGTIVIGESEPRGAPNLCATGAPNAIAVLAASEKGGLLHAPDLYMEKMIVGPSCKGAVDLDAPVADNLHAIAKRLNRRGEDLVVIVLDRPRHEKIIEQIRGAGGRGAWGGRRG